LHGRDRHHGRGLQQRNVQPVRFHSDQLGGSFSDQGGHLRPFGDGDGSKLAEYESVGECLFRHYDDLVGTDFFDFSLIGGGFPDVDL
jgi:hypothetical protein